MGDFFHGDCIYLKWKKERCGRNANTDIGSDFLI